MQKPRFEGGVCNTGVERGELTMVLSVLLLILMLLRKRRTKIKLHIEL